MIEAAGASEQAWRLLEIAETKDMTTRETSVGTGAGLVLHALDPARHRHLLLPLTDMQAGVEDNRSRGVSVVTRDLESAPETTYRYIDIECREVALNDLFSTVCDEILHQVSATPSAPGLCVTTVLDRWRDLLGPAAERLLGERAIKGLLAELHVLESLVSVEPELGMKIWTGVDRHRHDFTGLECACEVKASSLVDEIKVHINGLTQLSAPPSLRLYLLMERFERVPAGGDSLTDAAGRIEKKGVKRHAILTALAKNGIQPADLPVYREIQFRSLERRLYLVDDDFPRLTPDLLMGKPAADRISSVDYVLNLGVQPPAPLPADALDDLVGWLLAGQATQ